VVLPPTSANSSLASNPTTTSPSLLFAASLPKPFLASTSSLSHDLIYTQGTLVVGFTSVLASIFTRTPLLLKYVGDEPWETAISAGHTTLSLPLFYRHLSLCYLPHILFTRFSLLAAKHVITPSQRLKSTLSSIHPLLPSRITVIPNAVDTKPLSLKKRPFQLIFVGRLVPWKHVDLIIQAVSIARSKSHPWKLHLVGTGPQLASLKRQVTRLRAKSWIKFHHNLTRPATHRLIAQSQALLLYSSYEGLSHTAIEAMLLGTHIIASNIPANREVLGPSAQLVSLNSPKNLAHAINHPKPHLDANQKRAQSLYSWNNHLHSLTKLFSSLS